MRSTVFSISLLSTLCSSALAFGDAWSIGCAPETIQRSDPILSPGKPSGHVHVVIGGSAFSRSMTGTNAAENANATSCNTDIDRSNYWTPLLYHINSDGLFEMVKFTGVGLYYQNRACNYTTTTQYCQTYEVPSVAPPEGLRMIAGDSTRRTFNSTDQTNLAISLNCNGHNYYNGFPPAGSCKQLRAQVTYPSCWDGVNTDSTDHKSHVAYPPSYSGGVCPESHPVGIFSIFSEWYYDLEPYTDSKFVFANGDTTGNGYHGDFIMGWTNRTMLQESFENCDCSGGTCDQTTCPVRFQGWETHDNVQEPRPLMTPAVYEEEIGLNGPVKTLPGNNPVYTGPVGPVVTM